MVKSCIVAYKSRILAIEWSEIALASRQKYNNSQTMKVFVVALGALLVVAVSARPNEQYTTKWDNINLDDVLKSERLLKNYVNCLMERGNCTPDGKELKTSLPDALETDCSKCSAKQKDGTDKVIRFLVDNKPKIWDELIAKYDPEGKYRSKYEKKAKDLGVKV